VVEENRFIVPKVTNQSIGTFHYSDITDTLDNSNEYLLPIDISDFFNHSVKYCASDNYLLTLSVPHSSSTIDGKPFRYFMPEFIDVRLEDMTKLASPDIEYHVSRGYAEVIYESDTYFQLSPLKLDYFEHHRFKNYYHDLLYAEKSVFLVYFRSGKLKVWKYNESESNTKNKRVEFDVPELIDSYTWQHEQNFCVAYHNKSIYMILKNGEVYLLGNKMIKVAEISKSLDSIAIVSNRDEDKLYFIEKQYLHQTIPFNQLIKQYAQEINFKEKK
jgi:hypothetical protein